jgi:eukaryotic-like serine/threonine-protein kinase
MALTCHRCHRENTAEAKYCLHCGAMLDALTHGGDPLIGKVLLGRYRVLEILGEGGMGKVYLAEQKMGTASRKVAIKTLHPEHGTDPQLIARFHRECETVIELSHPNTVQFYDFGDVDGTLIIVMEYIEGDSLAHVLARGPVDAVRADRILIQVCGSLSEAHQRGVVHRDLKPENVLLTDRGGQADFVKVLDFGIAKRAEAEDPSQAKLTKQGMVLGTPPYMSPEQFSGQPLDPRSDVYSLGILAYEMLAGELPFEAQTPWEWATKHLTAEPAPLESHPAAAHMPDRQKAAIMRALVKDPAGRHGSVLEFMHEFTGMNDPSNAWTLATTPGAMAPSGAHAATAAPQAAGGDLAYAPTMPTPASGQVATAPAHGRPVDTGPAPQVPGLGLGKVLLLIATLVVLGGGTAAAGIVYWVIRDDGGPAGVVGNPGGTVAPNPSSGMGGGPPPEGPEADLPSGVDPGASEPEAEADDETDDEAAKAAPEEAPQAEPEPEPAPAPAKKRRAKAPTATAQAQALLQRASSALDRNDLGTAAVALAQARQVTGPRHARLQSLQQDLARKGSNQVGILMQQGRCGEAQALHRRLRAAGAHGPARVHFSDDWCPRP